MRLAHPLSRALVSLGFTLVLCALFLVPRLENPAQARPLQQEAIPTPNPALPVDLIVQTARSLFADRGATVSFRFRIYNNSACTSFGVQVTTATLTASNPGTVTVAPMTTAPGIAEFNVGFFVPSGADIGETYNGTVGVTCQQTTIDASDTENVSVTVTVRGATPTPTPPATDTPTPAATEGPSPTAGPVCLDTFEPDNTPSQSKEIRPDAPQTHVICPKGDEDFVYFGAISGKVYTIEVEEMSAGLDLSLSLYDAAGNLLAFNNDFPRDNDPFDIRPRIQSWRAPANGQYFIKIRDDAGRGDVNLSYSVELQSEAYGPTPTLIAELCADLFEPDGVPEQARLLVIRETQPNHKFCPTGDADWVRFFAKAGARFVLRTDSAGRAGADPVLVLVDRDGATILDFNDDAENTLDARIEFEVPVDGFYFAQLKNVGDIGSQFIAYDLVYEPLGVAAAPEPTADSSPTTETETTDTPTPTGTAGTTDETPTVDVRATQTAIAGYPGPTQTAIAATRTASANAAGLSGVKGAPAFVNGQSAKFVDPAMQNVWARTDQVVAARQVDRSWMWGPSGLVARVETYTQSNGGARQVQYFDKARMEITDWRRDRTNPWFVTNGLLVKELIDGQLQIGDVEFVKRAPAVVGIAGDADDASGPTYASFAGHMAGVESRVGQVATATLRRDGSTGTTSTRAAAKLVVHVPETRHNIPQVFWDFLNARGPIGDGKQTGSLVDWVFAMGYPISEPFWTKVKVGGVERDVLVQAFQRRVLTYTPSNPDGWQVEMGNVGRHYYAWRYGRQP